MGPAEPQTLYRLIELLDSAGRNEEATRAVRAGLALYPNNESLKDWRGRLSKKSLEK